LDACGSHFCIARALPKLGSEDLPPTAALSGGSKCVFDIRPDILLSPIQKRRHHVDLVGTRVRELVLLVSVVRYWGAVFGKGDDSRDPSLAFGYRRTPGAFPIPPCLKKVVYNSA